jgi:molybdate transport system ATP-binding protein
MIAGLLRPQTGSIHVGQTVLVDRSRGQWVPPHRRSMGVVFQDHLLFPHKTVHANLRYGMSRGGGRTEHLREVIEVLELGALLDSYPAHLSGGQQRRVALGRALVARPRLLLMDEPLTGLDQALRDRILDHLQLVHQRWGLPMLLVSHDQVVVRRLAQHVIVLEAGRVVDEGSVDQALDRATLQSMASHPGPINLLRVERAYHVGDHSAGVVGEQTFYLPRRTPGGTAYVRFLPRDVALTLEDVPRISMRNQLRGTIRDIIRVGDELGGDRIYIAVDVGQTIWAQLTPAACQELDLKQGTTVCCLIKATATEQLT